MPPSRRLRRTPWVLLLTALVTTVLAACSPLAGFGVTIRRDGTNVRIAVPGYRDPDTQAWLCPSEPPPGATRGDEGRRRLTAVGCLDLGFTTSIPPDAAGWQAVIPLETLASAQLEAFADRPAYRLLLVSGDGDSVRTYATDVPPVSLVP